MEDFGKGREIIIDEQEIADYLYSEFLVRGLGATTAECELIAELIFDFMLTRSIIDELEGEE